jgi:hypothetical protein
VSKLNSEYLVKYYETFIFNDDASFILNETPKSPMIKFYYKVEKGKNLNGRIYYYLQKCYQVLYLDE